MGKFWDIIVLIVMIILPPLGMLIETGCSCDFLINICLVADSASQTALGYIPGLVHALYVLMRRMEAEDMYGRGRIIYVGNAQFEPVYPVNQPQPPYYGSRG
ncbi:plasma membrane proteolipid [Ceratobasidium sp. AG-Ba]|nr:plasma membrane proteolipid [Ceratobasidium sp. AG-Ba]